MKMDFHEYNRMLFERIHNEQRWENQPAKDWTIEDLNIDELRNTIAEAVRVGRLTEPESRKPEDLLLGLGLLDNDGIMFRAARVLFGKTERLNSKLPQCLLRLARFRGTNRSEFLDNRQYIGNTFVLLSHAERFLHETLPIPSRFNSDQFQRIDEPLYPPLATREAIANALCHRDYSLGGSSIGLAIYEDCLEVTSAGGLHFGITPDDLFDRHESKPWNPLIARTFYLRGIIEEWGRGTQKVAEIALKAGLPRPEIEDLNDCVTVRFRHGQIARNRKRGYDQIKRQKAILELLAQKEEGLSLREIHAKLPMKSTIRQVKRTLTVLRKGGMARSSGFGIAAHWILEHTGINN